MQITIPPTLNQILDRDPALKSALILNLSKFEVWVSNSGVPFFPEYTDHGPKHISDVLIAASSLISDEGKQLLSPNDVATLVLAILLHDIGMHLTADSFRALITQKDAPLVEVFDRNSWADLWDGFLRQASRYDERTLTKIFGDSEPINIKQIDIKNLKERDHLLVGEFLRIHHCRLAHEIALSGVPGPSEQSLRFENIDTDLLDIAGLVARSHGMDIRNSFEYLETKYHLRNYREIHAVFLMATLRIADYLQLQSERAPKDLLHVKKIRSPYSKKEWDAHHSIRNIHTTHEDPEAIYIDALPKSAEAFLKFKRLFQDIQKELDHSWAALGEVYGRYPNLKGLSLTIRRVRSSIDNSYEFTKKQQIKYLPVLARFEANNADLLKLLVGPLYGNELGVAVRELIQNSVDACRERDDWQNMHPIVTSNCSGDDVKILFSKDKDRQWLTIRDRGIGMTADTVINYFLKAGASFRSSQLWKENHEDEMGSSKVLRGGRFGVGVLAYFLLGKNIEVVTRHITAEKGLKFKTSLDTENIELEACDAEVGTTIKIELSERAREKITPRYVKGDKKPPNWPESLKWYYLATPSVRFWDDNTKFSYAVPEILPQPNAQLPSGWNRISHQDFEDIHWTYNDDYSMPSLACNGIEIEHGFSGQYYRNAIAHGYSACTNYRMPKISVFDPNALLPLNLQRDRVSSIPFREELRRSIAEDHLAYLLASRSNADLSNLASYVQSLKYRGLEANLKYNQFTFCPYWANKDGFGLLDFNAPGLENVSYFLCGLEGFEEEKFIANEGVAFIYGQPIDVHAKTIMNILFGDVHNLFALNFVRSAMLLPKSSLDWVKEKRLVRKDMLDRIHIAWTNDSHCIIQNKPYEDSLILQAAVSGLIQPHGNDRIFEFKKPNLTWPRSDNQNVVSQFVEVWHEYLGSIIPFDIQKRKEKFSDAFDKLEDRINYHKKVFKRDAI